MKRNEKPRKGSSKYRSSYRKFKYIIMLFVIVPILVLSSVITTSYSKKLNAEIEKKYDVAIHNIAINTEQEFSDIGRIVSMTYYNTDFVDYMESYLTVQERQGSYYNSLRVRDAYKTMLNACEYVRGFAVWSLNNDCSIYPKDATDRELYEKCRQENEPDKIYYSDKSIIITKAIVNIEGDRVGMFAFEYDKKQLEQKLDLAGYDCDIAVKLVKTDSEELFGAGNVTPIKTLEYDAGAKDIKLQILIGNKDNEERTRMVFIYSTLCIVSCLVVGFVISIICAKILFNTVKNVFSKMGKGGEPALTLASNNGYIEDIDGKDMEEKFAAMLDKMNNMQLTSLQMQINPHFVFNVLNYINLKIQKDNESKESKIIMLLSKVLGYAMSEPKYSAKIAEEVIMTEQYIEIERIKLGDIFDVEWQIDEKVLDMECIKLFLQPIVENSISHGIKELHEKRGRITITAKPTEDGVCFAVADNGLGMTGEQLRAVRARLAEGYSDSSKHIGLRNVNERIKMVYGKNYGVTIDSDGNGTTVTIRIGKTKATNEKENI